MRVSLLLPETDYTPAVNEQVVVLPDMVAGSEPDALAALVGAQHPAPDRVVGGDHTPVLAWVTAARCLPGATFWLKCGATGVLRQLDSSAAAPVDESEPAPRAADAPASRPPSPKPPGGAPTSQGKLVEDEDERRGDERRVSGELPRPGITPAESKPVKPDPPERRAEARGEPAPAATPKAAPGLADMSDGQLLFEVFKYSAWGEEEHQRSLALCEEEVLRRVETGGKDLLIRLTRSKRTGARAAELAGQLLSKLEKQGDCDEVRAWRDKVCPEGTSERVVKHLERTLLKWRERQRKRKASMDARKNGKKAAFVLEPVVLQAGRHPNCLRHLAPATEWEILVDETGHRFDESADELAVRDQALGRLVALAVPAGVKLPDLAAGSHATDDGAEVVDRVVQAVLRAPVGVFGFTVKDDIAGGPRWISHVWRLLSWVMYQLPVKADQPARVKVFVEQRAPFNAGHSLDALAQSLEAELRELAPERYRHLTLTMELIAKTDHKLNGYVDGVAYTWGSPSERSRRRLKRSRWLGHCLLQPDVVAMERLYDALHNLARLRPAEWFDLCSAASEEPQEGLMRAALAGLGERVRDDAALWSTYLDETARRLRIKQFTLSELLCALEWLERWRPAGETLPAALAMRLEATRLVLENHHGVIDQARFERCRALSVELMDEAPQDCCEVVLRLAVAAMNRFDFGRVRATLEQWLSQPVAVAGLLNFGKLLSTRGQIEAFEGRLGDAVRSFEEAEALFGRLSDSRQREREQLQTRIYRLIAGMDDASVAPKLVLDDLTACMVEAVGKGEPGAVSRALAVSGQDKRFVHHLWLRAMICYPEAMQEARSSYLAQQGNWACGEDHPWGLIQAYRAWLLVLADRREEAAPLFDHAVALCGRDDSGPTLEWIAEALRLLASSLGIELESPPSKARRAELAKSLPGAPHAALGAMVALAADGSVDHPARLSALSDCLPFNYH